MSSPDSMLFKMSSPVHHISQILIFGKKGRYYVQDYNQKLPCTILQLHTIVDEGNMRKRMGKHNLLIVRCENEALNLLSEE